MNSEFYQTYNLVPVSIFEYKNNVCLTIVYANTQFYKFIGYSKEQFQDKYANNLINLVHSEDKHKLAKLNTNSECYFRIICRDNTVKWVLFKGNNSLGDNSENCLGILLDITEEKLLQHDFATLSNEMSYLFDTIPGGLVSCRLDNELTIIDANQGFFNFFKIDKLVLQENYKNKLMNLIINENTIQSLLNLIKKCEITGNASSQLKMQDYNNKDRWVWINCLVKRDLKGEKQLYCFFLDISKQKRYKQELEVGKRIYEIVFSQTQDVVYEWNCITNEIYHTENYEKKFGYSPVYTNFPQSVLDSNTIHPEDESIFWEFFMNLKHGIARTPVEYRILNQDGKYIWCQVSGQKIKDSEGQIQKVIGMISDIDKQKQKVLKAQELAKRDPLTGLYNHGATEEQISEYLREQKEFAAILVIDIDNFKEVNDSYGHIYGDAVLSEFAYRLKTIFRKNDIIGRFGGDEFVVFLSEIDEEYDIERSAKEVLSIFWTDFFDNDVTCKITASIGVARTPLDGNTYKEIFEKADIALYYAKNHGKNTYAIYNEYMNNAMLQGTNITKIKNERVTTNRSYTDNLGDYIFKIFYENPDIEQAIPILLDLVGRSMNVSRAYIFEYHENEDYFLNTFEWCNKGIDSMKQKSPIVGIDIWDYFHTNSYSSDLFYCIDVSKIDNTNIKDWLESRNTKATMIWKVCDEGRVEAIVGLEQCDRTRVSVQQERDALAILSNVISLFLIKKRKNEALKLHKAMSKKLLDHIKAFFYVIEPNTYKILYFDKYGGSSIPDSSIGDICYHVFRNREKPCEQCPLFGITSEKPYSISHIYNPDLDMWTENHASTIPWKSGENAYLISSIDITKYKQNYFTNIKQAQDVYFNAMDAYLVKRDIKEFLQYLDDDILCIGTGVHEIALNKEKLKNFLEQELKFDSTSYSISFNDTKAKININGTVSLYTLLKVKRKSLNGEIIEVAARETATLTKSNNAYKISLLHGSVASTQQSEGEFFPIKVGEKTIAQIWEDERIRNYQFLDNSVPGGMLSVQYKKNFPIIFINARMLNYLGYKDTQEFIKNTNGLIINCVYKEDRKRVESHIWTSLTQTDYYEVIYRMLKKDGSYIWVCEKGKKVTNVDKTEAILCVCLDITSTKEAEKELLDNNTRFNVVVEQTNICVWDYNIQSRQVIHTQSSKNRYHCKRDITPNVPESIIHTNRIHKDSVKDLEELFNRISTGEQSPTAEICFWDDRKNGWCWENVIYRTFFDELGNPIKAIGIGQDITKQKEAELKFQKEQEMMNSLSEGVIASYRVNITKNLVDYIQSTEKREEVCNLRTYEELLKCLQKFIVNTEEKEKLNAIFNKDNIVKLQKEGKKAIQWEFRRHDIKGNISWVCATANITIEKQTGDLYLCGTIRDINESKKLELSLKQKVERDSITGVYNRETAILIINDAMKSLYTKDLKNVMVLLTIENYKEIVIKSGEKAANKMLLDISKILECKFGKIQIIGRIYSDSFLLLIGGHTNTWVEQTANSVVQLLKTPYFFVDINVPVIVSVGIAQQTDHIDNFEKLYLKTSLAAQIASSKGKNNCVVYNNNLGCATIGNSTLANLQDANKKFLKEQDTVLLSCAVAMVSMDDIALGVNKTLKDISDYYHSAHVFVAQFNEFEKENLEVYEFINEDNKDTLSSDYCNAIKTIFSSWVNLLNEDGVIIANDKGNIENLYNDSFNYQEHHYVVENVVVVPLNAKGKVFGFICLENRTQSKNDLSLISSISAFISHHLLKKQLYLKQEYLEKHDTFTGLLNRSSYLDYRISIAEDVLSSLGVAVIDINGLKKINNQYGLLYGDSILKFVAEKLKHCFDDSSIYRFGEDEFVAISQNLTKESFERKCKRFKYEVHQNCTVGISVGYVWADSNINLDNMLKHADERMMIAKMEYYKDTQSLNRHHNPSVLKSIFSAIKSKEFKMYLQPKADVNTGDIVSAEALVRLYSKERGIIFPDKFIPQMEEDGTIKYLDLFMFEEVCRTIHKWLENGIKPITVSLNFSRSTLLATDLIDSMSLIYQKYNVPKELIEIEITESFGEMEKETVVQIACKIVDMGFRLSLDDFGSKYSNISILSAIKLDALKLDKSIVNDLFSNNNTRIVVKNFLCICKELGIESVAEGVETEEQLDILRQFGCDMAQGYLFNKPIPLEDFEQKYLNYELV